MEFVQIYPENEWDGPLQHFRLGFVLSLGIQYRRGFMYDKVLILIVFFAGRFAVQSVVHVSL